MEPGSRIDEAGTLLRVGSAFVLKRDAGGRYVLGLGRTPIDQVGKRVRVIGTYVGDDLVDADGVSLI